MAGCRGSCRPPAPGPGRQGRAVDVAWAANEILPVHGLGGEPETPVRPPPCGLQGDALVVSQRQRGPVVDRRQAAGLHALAPPLEFVGRLISGIEQASLLQAFGGLAVERDAVPTGAARGPAGCRARRGRPRSTRHIRRASARRPCRRSGARRCRRVPLANRKFSTAVRALPMWIRPVGDGAKRTTGGDMGALWRSASRGAIRARL